jgi:hypothetical protein
MKSTYRVTYVGTRKTDSFKTKKAALAQARWATSIGNSKACVQIKLPSGGWQDVTCVRRRRRKR